MVDSYEGSNSLRIYSFYFWEKFCHLFRWVVWFAIRLILPVYKKVKIDNIIWTQVAKSTSNDNNHYAMSTLVTYKHKKKMWLISNKVSLIIYWR